MSVHKVSDEYEYEMNTVIISRHSKFIELSGLTPYSFHFEVLKMQVEVFKVSIKCLTNRCQIVSHEHAMYTIIISSSTSYSKCFEVLELTIRSCHFEVLKMQLEVFKVSIKCDNYVSHMNLVIILKSDKI